MKRTNDVALHYVLPGCYCRDGKARNMLTGEILPRDPYKDGPVIVRFRGQLREAVRMKWLWRIVAWVQGYAA